MGAWAFTALTSSWLSPSCSFASLWHVLFGCLAVFSSSGMNFSQGRKSWIPLVSWAPLGFYTRMPSEIPGWLLWEEAQIGASANYSCVPLSPPRAGAHPVTELLQTFTGGFQHSSGALWEQDKSSSLSQHPSPAGDGQRFPHPLQTWELQAEAEPAPSMFFMPAWFLSPAWFGLPLVSVQGGQGWMMQHRRSLEVLEQLWEGRQRGCDRAEQGRGCREAQERGGEKHSMPGGTGEAQWCEEMGKGRVGRAAGRKIRCFPKAGIRKSLLPSLGRTHPASCPKSRAPGP